ncbi:MAG: hypothetical protein AVDCRST_MAG27-4558, partial [uncultured Craurococcus sp.]
GRFAATRSRPASALPAAATIRRVTLQGDHRHRGAARHMEGPAL